MFPVFAFFRINPNHKKFESGRDMYPLPFSEKSGFSPDLFFLDLFSLQQKADSKHSDDG